MNKLYMDKLDEIIALLQSIETRITNIETRLDTVETDCNKMSKHINFVENVYDIMRTPLNYLHHKVKYIMNDTSLDVIELPSK